MNTGLTRNLEDICNRLLKSDKPKILVDKISSVEELLQKRHSQFLDKNRRGDYLWQVDPHIKDDEYKNMHAGVLLDETLNYVHLSFVSTEVLDYILKS